MVVPQADINATLTEDVHLSESPLAANWSLPVDLVAIRARADWRNGLWWPCDYRAIRKTQEGLFDCSLGFVRSIDDPSHRRVAAVAAPRLDNIMRRLGWIGMHVDAAAATGAVLGASCPLLDAMQAADDAPAEQLAGIYAITAQAGVGYATTKQAIRRLWWARSQARALGALIAPATTAISHNALLRASAAGSRAPVGFRYAEEILSGAQAAAPRECYVDTDELAWKLKTSFLGYYQTDHPIWRRMGRFVGSFARLFLRNVSADLASLSRLRSFPMNVWTGSVGNYAVRAMAAELQRREGHMTWFDHGGSISMIDEDRSLSLNEMIAQDACVMPTEPAAIMMRERTPTLLLRPGRTPEISARFADPTFVRAARSPRRPPGRKPTVTYITTIYGGTRQHYPPLLPDPVYLDLQHRVVECLSKLPIDLRLRPHPEIDLRSGIHPLTGHCTIDLRPFAEVLRDTDVFVFDYPQSTTFWEATCSDRRVVLIDLGISRFNETARQVIARRCHVLTPEWNARNLPEFDAEALADAMCGAAPAADPADMRRLLVA